MVHPDELGLKGYEADEEILKVCGKQIIIFVDAEDEIVGLGS